MATVDLPRALRLLERIDDRQRPAEKARGLAVIAYALKRQDPFKAKELLRQAFDAIPVQYAGGRSHVDAVVGTSLLLVGFAEEIDPGNLTEYYWRAILNQPGPSGRAWSPEDAERLIDWYAHDPSSGIHGATGWLLRQWGFEEQTRNVDQMPVAYQPGREWFTLELKPKAGERISEAEPESSDQLFYMTFVVFDPGEYVMGSPNNETNHKPIEPLHVVRITRPFAVLDREITRAEVNAYGLTLTADDRTSPTPEHSMGGPSWYDAVGFCRWLGQCRELAEEDQVYPDSTTSGGRTNQAGSPFVEPDSSEWTARWDRTGFRLPSEAEWEIACRGGMRTAHGFGGDSALLGRYAWFEENSGRKGHVPRLLRPNLRGLFDTHGNIWEWCHDWIDYYPTDVAQDPVGPLRGSARVCRGGSWVNYLSECRSADRNATNPASRTGDIGFRVAVTCATHVEVDRF